MTRFIHSFIFLQLLHIYVNAQVVTEFKKLTIEDGLVNNKVNCFARDRIGAIWIGTEDGLSRYNGYSFMNFQYNILDSISISHNAVYDLLFDGQNSIYIGTFNGICSIDINTYKITRYPFKDRKRNVIVHEIKKGKDNRIYLATHLGLMTIDFTSQKILPVKIDGIEQDYDIHCIEIDSENRLWYSLQYHGLVKLNLNTLHADTFAYPHYIQSQYGTLAKDLLIDNRNNNRIWIASWARGLILFDRNTKSFTQYLVSNSSSTFGSNHIFLNLCQSARNSEKYELWVNSLSEGLLNFDLKTRQFTSYKSEHPHNKQGVYGDGLGLNYIEPILWVGTTEGVNYYSSDQQILSQLLFPDQQNSSQYIYSLLPSIYDSIISFKSSLQETILCNYITGKRNTSSHIESWLKNKNIFYSYTSKNGIKYYFDYKNGLIKDNHQSLVPILYQNKTIAARQILEDSHQNLYISSPEGIFRYSELNHTIVPLIHADGQKLKKNLSYRTEGLCMDRKGNIWFSTTSDGYLNACIGKITNDQLAAVYHSQDSYSTMMEQNIIGNLVCDHRNRLYASTWNGILHWDAGDQLPVFKYQNKNTGLVNNKVYQLLLSKADCIYANTLGGLTCWDLKKNALSNYTIQNGLFSNDVKDIQFSKNENDLFIAFENKVQILPLNNIFSPSKSISVQIDRLSISNKEVLPRDQYMNKSFSLSPDQNNLILELSTYQFTDPIKYQYRIYNQDKKWINANNNTVHLSSLSPGNYDLRFRAITEQGNCISPETTLSFTISNYWYKTWWFFLSLFLISLSIIYIFYRLKLKRIRDLFQLRNTIAQDLHDDIGSTITSIQILSNISKGHIDKNPNRAKELLDKIQKAGYEIQQSMSDIVWAVNPSNDLLLDLIHRIQYYTNGIASEKPLDIKYMIAPQIQNQKIEMYLRKEILLICKEITHNTIKHAQAQAMNIKFDIIHQKLIITITDNGVGFERSNISYGNGLKNIEQRAAQIGALLQCSSTLGQGTCYQLEIQLRDITTKKNL